MGAVTIYAALRQRREVFLQTCAMLGGIFIVVRGAGNVWDAIRQEFPERAGEVPLSVALPNKALQLTGMRPASERQYRSADSGMR